MAITTLQIDVNTGESVKSLSDLKKEFKDIQKELTGLTPGTQEYVNTLKKLGAVKDEIGDLKDEINAFAGADKKIAAVTNVIGGLSSGFQAAQGAAALFGGESEDLQKTLLKVQAAMAFTEGIKGIASLGDSFKVLGNIIKANPLMLITTIIIGIGTALFALKDKIAIVGKAFDFLGGILDTVVGAVKDFTDWIGISSFKADEAHKKLMENAEAAKTAITERYDAEIRAAKRAGKETEVIEESKIRNLYLQNYKQIKALQDRGKQRTTEENKQLIELISKNKEYYQQLLDLDDAQKDKLLEKQKKAAEERKKLKDDEQKWLIESNREALRRQAEMNKEFEDDQKKKQDELNKLENERIEAEIQAEQKRLDDQKNKRLKAAEDYKKAKEQEVQLTLQGLQTIQSLTDAFAGQSEESQKRAFNIKKAASLAQATIETYQAAQSAYSSQMTIPTPDAPVRAAIAAGIAIASGLARVAVIAKQKFEAPSTGGGGGGGGATLGTFTQTGGGQPPQGLTAQNTVTQLNPDGTVAGQGQRQSAPMKAYVVESESRTVTERINKLSNNSKIG